MLPCDECCGHYCSTMDKVNFEAALEGRTQLTRWLFEFHNNVNLRLGKPRYSWEALTAEFQGEGTECAVESPCGAGDVHIPVATTEAVDAFGANAFESQKAAADAEVKCPESPKYLAILPTSLALVGLFVVLYLMFSK